APASSTRLSLTDSPSPLDSSPMSSTVARLFDAMADTYDDLEPWYEHLYDVLHAILRETIGQAPAGGGSALDAGCGTGFQAALLAELGWRPAGPGARSTRATGSACPIPATAACGSSPVASSPGCSARPASAPSAAGACTLSPA